jgi:predicted naringenin-chalcone synthase
MGTAVPRGFMGQDAAADLLVAILHGPGRARAVRALYARSGIRKRHSVLVGREDGPAAERQAFYAPARASEDGGPTTAQRMAPFEEEAPPLATEASRLALADAGLGAAAVTHLVTVSCTGFFAPGMDAALIHRLGLAPTVERTHVGFMGCHGALNGLRLAASLAVADPRARVLLCSVELCSLHLAYSWDPQALVANALFSDGAAALVGVGEGVRGAGGEARPRGAGPASRWRVAATGTLLFPDSADAMSWRIGDHGFRMTLSPSVPAIIEGHVARWLRDWLAGHGLGQDDVRTWAVHPGGPRVLGAFGAAMGLPRDTFEVSRQVLADFGNMSSATLLFILERLRDAGAEGPVVAIAFGPGLVAEAALLV